MAKIDSLVVSLEAETAGLRRGLDEATSSLKSFGDRTDGVLRGISDKLAAIGVVGALKMGKALALGVAEFIASGAEAQDAAGKLAATAQVSVESFSSLSYAAKLGGVSAEELAGAFGFLNRNIAAAGAGSKQQAQLFASLGIAVRDGAGHLRTADAVFRDITKSLEKMADGPAKAALEVKLLGREGAKLDSVMRSGAAGLAELEAEAKRFGLVVGTEAAANAAAFNDNLTKLGLVGQSVGASLAAQVTPALTAATDAILKSKDGAELLKQTTGALANSLKLLLAVLAPTVAGLVVFATTTAGAAKVAIAAAALDAKALGKALADVGRSVVHAGATVDQVWSALWKDKPATNALKGEADGVNDTLDKLTKDLEEKASRIAAAAEKVKKALADAARAGAGQAGGEGAEQAASRAATNAGRSAGKALGEASAQADRDRAWSDFDTQRSSNRVSGDNNERRDNFAAIGESFEASVARATAGFKDYDAALDAITAESRARDEFTARAAEQRAAGDDDAARSSLLMADAADRAAAAAERAADGFEKSKKKQADDAEDEDKKRKAAADRAQKEQDAAFDKLMAGIGAAGQHFVSKLGDLGSIINAGIQGGQSGGIWGALIAVIIELLSRFEGFKQIMDIANGAVKFALDNLAGGLGNLVQGLKPLFGAVSTIAHAVHNVLGPILTIIGKLFEGIAPILWVVGMALQQVSSSLGPAFTIIEAIVGTLKILEPVLGVVAIAMMGLKLAMDYVNLGFNMFLDWVLEFFGGNNNSGVDNAQKQVDATTKEIEDFVNAFIKDPFNAVSNAAKAAAWGLEQNGKQNEKAAKAIDKLSAAFTNVPDTVKLGALRFNAADPDRAAPSFGSIAPPPRGDTYVFNVQGSVVTEQRLADLVTQYHRRRDYERTGRSF